MANNRNPPNNLPQSRQPQQLTPELAERLLNQQAEQLKVRQREIDLEEKDATNQYNYAKQALDVQANDLQKAREHEGQQTLKQYIFAAAIVLFILAFLGYALHLNKDEIAKDVVKILIGFIGGGAGGYALGRNASKTKDKENE
jgi:hypothetical protein